MFIVEKDGVQKKVSTEHELGMYISAGWKKVEQKLEEKKPAPSNRNEYQRDND